MKLGLLLDKVEKYLDNVDKFKLARKLFIALLLLGAVVMCDRAFAEELNPDELSAFPWNSVISQGGKVKFCWGMGPDFPIQPHNIKCADVTKAKVQRCYIDKEFFKCDESI